MSDGKKKIHRKNLVDRLKDDDEIDSRRMSTVTSNFASSLSNRRFSGLNLPTSIACYTPSKAKCTATSGLDNVHTELLSLLLCNNTFRDFLNVFLLLPVHAHQCIVKFNGDACYFEAFPLIRGSGCRLSADRVLQWIYSNRLPFFLSSRLYQLCLFTQAFCEDNVFLTYNENAEYTKKELNMFGDLRTVEGIQKLLRHAGNSADGALIQLWLDLQCLRHTPKDNGHMDMMKNIRDSYSDESNPLPFEFKRQLADAVELAGGVSLNTCLITRREDLWKSYDILLDNPFVQHRPKTSLRDENPLLVLQDDVLKALKTDFCKRFLLYYDCLPAYFKYGASLDFSVTDSVECQLTSGRSKSTLPSIGELFIVPEGQEVGSKERPKTCYPHLHPKPRVLSRISGKTSGYVSMTPDEKLADYVEGMQEDRVAPKKWKSQELLSVPETFEMKKQKSLPDLSTLAITVNDDAMKFFRERIATEAAEQETCSNSTDLPQSPGPTVSFPSSKMKTPSPKNFMPAVTLPAPRMMPKPLASHLVPERSPSVLENSKNTFASELRKFTQSPDKSFSPEAYQVRRKSTFHDAMATRRASQFTKNIPIIKGKLAIASGGAAESKKVSEEIIKNKTADSMLQQDKGRLLIAFLASDKLASGPFRNYLLSTHNDLSLQYLEVWEWIEVIRCLTTEGGRRGATAKSFGGNGFLSCHDEWPVLKDDPYYQYSETLRHIKKHSEPLLNFLTKFNLLKDFAASNPIKKPLNVQVLQKYIDELNTIGCHDEILALIQIYLTYKLRKNIESYSKFDSNNFFYYLSQADTDSRVEAFVSKVDRMIGRSQRRFKRYNTAIDLQKDTIFSPKANRLWVAVDICEKLIFPFALRKLSMPMLTFSTMIKMKMFLVRRRKQKAICKAENEPPVIGPIIKAEAPRRKKGIRKYVLGRKVKADDASSNLFVINWKKKVRKHEEDLLNYLSSLKDRVNLELEDIAPPTIEDLFSLDSTGKVFRKYILRNHKGAMKDQLLNIANFITQEMELEKKIDSTDFPELSRSLCSTFVFGKASILHEFSIPDDMVKLIVRKRSGNPTFLLHIFAIVKAWIYTNVWDDFISKTYSEEKIHTNQFSLIMEYNQLTSKRPIFSEKLAKRMMHFVIRSQSFLQFLSNAAQFEEFRLFLVEQGTQIDKDGSRLDQVLFGKQNSQFMVCVTKLPQDLFFLIELLAYRDLLRHARTVARDMSLTGNEEATFLAKVNTILELFLDSVIPPKLQVNLLTGVAADLVISFRSMHYSYGVVTEALSNTLRILLLYWKKFCIQKYVPSSKKKAAVLSRLSGSPVAPPAPPLTSRLRLKSMNGITLTRSSSSRFSASKGTGETEVGGVNFSLTQGFQDIHRAKTLPVTAAESNHRIRSDGSTASRHSTKTVLQLRRASSPKKSLVPKSKSKTVELPALVET